VGINQPVYGPKAQGYVRPNLYYEGSLAEKETAIISNGDHFKRALYEQVCISYVLKVTQSVKDYVFRLDRMENQSI
jgi:hypothetical protein